LGENNEADVRKLIKFGSSSFVISLPSSWVKIHGLKKGDNLYLNETDGRDLILTASKDKKVREIKKAVINVNNKLLDRIKREIISVYISGCTHFVLEDLKGYTEEIDKSLHNLMGLEVVEQTSERTIVKDFLDIEEVSVDDIFRRMDLIVRSMITDSKNCFNNQFYRQINHRDITVNKLRFLMLRILNESLHNQRVMETIQKSGMTVYDAWLLLINLEDIADASRRIARLLKEKRFSPLELKEINEVYNKIETSYLQAIKAFYKKDKDVAHKVADNKFMIVEKCDNLFKKTKNKWMVSILEKFKGMESYVRNIARIVINQ